MCRVRNKTKTAFLDRNVVPGSANQSDSKYTPNHVHTFKRTNSHLQPIRYLETKEHFSCTTALYTQHRYIYLKNIILAFST